MTDSNGDTPRGDDVLLLPNGMVRLVFDDREIMLARPTIGVLRERREALHTLNDETSRRAAAEQGENEARRRIASVQIERISAKIDEALDADDLDEEAIEGLYADKAQILNRVSQEDRTTARAFNDWVERQRLEWAAGTISALAIGNGDVAPDDLPSWLTDAQFAPKIIGHWRTVPSRSGGS